MYHSMQVGRYKWIYNDRFLCDNQTTNLIFQILRRALPFNIKIGIGPTRIWPACLDPVDVVIQCHMFIYYFFSFINYQVTSECLLFHYRKILVDSPYSLLVYHFCIFLGFQFLFLKRFLKKNNKAFEMQRDDKTLFYRMCF